MSLQFNVIVIIGETPVREIPFQINKKSVVPRNLRCRRVGIKACPHDNARSGYKVLFPRQGAVSGGVRGFCGVDDSVSPTGKFVRVKLSRPPSASRMDSQNRPPMAKIAANDGARVIRMKPQATSSAISPAHAPMPQLSPAALMNSSTASSNNNTSQHDRTRTITPVRSGTGQGKAGSRPDRQNSSKDRRFPRE